MIFRIARIARYALGPVPDRTATSWRRVGRRLACNTVKQVNKPLAFSSLSKTFTVSVFISRTCTAKPRLHCALHFLIFLPCKFASMNQRSWNAEIRYAHTV